MRSTLGSSLLEVRDLTIGYDENIVLRDLNFSVRQGEIFVVMGGSGCGKSTLLKSLIGLHVPFKGKVLFGGKSFWDLDEEERRVMMRDFGVLYQSGALWSSLTLAENVALPLELYADLTSAEIRDRAVSKLALVGLDGYGDRYPSEISGGMRKRAGIARAMALDPELLFLDEPSAGLDPVNAQMLDDLILELKNKMGATLVIVTHELASIFAVGDNAVFLDAETKTIIAQGRPNDLLAQGKDPRVLRFLTRGKNRESGNE